jgi:hypothetical protein
MLLRHARPHLEIHSRSKGHSAVAGAAYRLGLRLYDERQQVWHDYRRRALGEEIVMALTVAPEGAPPWASDPAQLWNAVEASERRKDSRVARDYRIPIPLGLDDERAGQLAEKLARFIMAELGTPVSIGLHRDAALDALGQVKPPERQGYHAHLYFPSRPLVIAPLSGEADGVEPTATFGARHPMLASQALGKGMVELFNRTWAGFANAAATEAGLPADFDHRSYKRMGVPLTPQPKMSTAATALERKGFFTREGDAVREIVVLSKAYELAHIEAVAAQRDQALVDMAREASATSVTPVVASAEVTLEHEAVALSDRLPPTRRRHARSPWADKSKVEPEALSPGSVDTRPLTDTPLIARFRETAPVAVTLTEHQTYERLLRLLRIIERALRALKSFAIALAQHEDDRQRRMAAKLDTETALDDSRAYRAAADTAVKRWEAAHPWRMMRARAFKGKSRKPRQWRELAHEVQINNQHVQELKSTIKVHQTHLDDLAETGDALKARQASVVNRLRTTVATFARLSPMAVAPFLAVLPEGDRYRVEALLPKPIPDTAPGKIADGPKPKPDFQPRSARPIP